MDKIINNGYRCSCNGMTEDAIVKVIEGNDVTLDIQLTKYNTEQEIWESYSLLGKDDVQCYLLTPNGTHIDLDTEVQLDGKVNAKAESYQLENNMIYGIGVDWKDDDDDLSVKAKGMVKVVRYSEVTEDYDITVTDNATYISMGQLPQDAITPDELTVVLGDYVTNSSLSTTLEDYVQDSDLDNYVTDSDLSTVLEDYVSDNELSSALSDYVTETSLNNTLQDYVTNNELSDYVTQTSLTTTLSDYVTDTELTTSLNPYVTSTSLTTTLEDYVLDSELSNTLDNYVTLIDNENQNEAISNSLVSLDDRVTTLEQNPGGGGTGDVSMTDLDNYLEATAAALVEQEAQIDSLHSNFANYVTISDNEDQNEAISNSLVSLNSRVATIEQSGVAPSNMVTTDTTQTITGTKTFTAANTFSGRNTFSANNKFTDETEFLAAHGSGHLGTFEYIDSGIFKSSLFTRAEMDQLIVGQVMLPQVTKSNSDSAFDVTQNTITFNKITSITNPSKPVLQQVAKIDDTGIYEGTTLLSDKYVTIEDNEDQNEAISNSLVSLNSRVTTLEQNPGGGGTGDVMMTDLDNYLEATATALSEHEDRLDTVQGLLPQCVFSSDADHIDLVTQAEYDALVSGGTVDPDTLYYITDATSDYVTNSEMTSAINTAIAGVTIDETNLVHKSGAETIGGAKTFTGACTWTNGSNFGASSMANNSSLMSADIASGLYKTGQLVRPSALNLITGQIIAPNQRVDYDSGNSILNEVNTIKFQKVDSVTNASKPVLSQLAKIDTNGIYEGTTLLANKYVQSSTIRNIVQISQNDYDTLVAGGTVDANTMYVII